MQIVPDAVGQSEGAVVFWADKAEAGVAWPRSTQVVDEIRWGIGSLNQEECLVLYLFANQQSAELYLLETLSTTPSESINVWELLCEWRPEVMKLRYGATPADKAKEVTFLLPTSEGEAILDKLRVFRDEAMNGISNAGETAAENEDTVKHRRVLEVLTSCLEDSANPAG